MCCGSICLIILIVDSVIPPPPRYNVLTVCQIILKNVSLVNLSPRYVCDNRLFSIMASFMTCFSVVCQMTNSDQHEPFFIKRRHSLHRLVQD